MSYLFARIILRLKLNNQLFSAIYIDWNEGLSLEDESTLKLFHSRFVFIQGWLYRSDSFIQKHKKIILDFFKPTDFHLNSVNRLLSSDQEVLIGIHIRQGDYKTFEGGKYHFEMHQYRSLMKRALTMHEEKKILFLICSDSNLKNEDFSDFPFIFGTGKEIEDLYAFSKCNYLIGPPSTFTMWASFYGDVPLHQVHNPEAAFTLEDFKVVSS